MVDGLDGINSLVARLFGIEQRDGKPSLKLMDIEFPSGKERGQM
jgi:hypothetical protein